MSFFRSRMQSIITKLLLVLACASLASCGARQDGFDWGRMVLFSAIAGKLVKDGKPVANATITREANFHGSKHSDSTATDKDGNFSFETMKTFTLLYQVLPSEPVMGQKMFAVVGEAKNLIWENAKYGYEDNSELNYDERISNASFRSMKIDTTTNPITVSCELTATRIHTGFIFTSCSFLPSKTRPAAEQ
jgi:hypothetical protein